MIDFIAQKSVLDGVNMAAQFIHRDMHTQKMNIKQLAYIPGLVQRISPTSVTIYTIVFSRHLKVLSCIFNFGSAINKSSMYIHEYI